MLIPRKAQRKTVGGQGVPAIGLAELRRQLANGASLDDAHRQRLLELAQRLARVQALGDEYNRVALSPQAAAAVDHAAAAV